MEGPPAHQHHAVPSYQLKLLMIPTRKSCVRQPGRPGRAIFPPKHTTLTTENWSGSPESAFGRIGLVPVSLLDEKLPGSLCDLSGLQEHHFRMELLVFLSTHPAVANGGG